SRTATGLTTGNYSVTVTDSNGCTTTQAVSINLPSPLNVNVSSSNVSCNGASTGSATVIPSGGTPPYIYSWSTTPVQTTSTATGLPAGNYSVTVTDSNHCATTQTVSITQP